jgi:hypothetical protein
MTLQVGSESMKARQIAKDYNLFPPLSGKEEKNIYC